MIQIYPIALRPNDAISIHEHVPSDAAGIVIGVAVIDAPAFPGPRETTFRNVGSPKVVVACYHFARLDGWGFIELDSSAKQAIGDMLTGAEAESGRWYYAHIVSRTTAPAPAAGDGGGRG